jgi:hypothetical protein
LVLQTWRMDSWFGGCLNFRLPYTQATGDVFWSLIVYIWHRPPFRQATGDALMVFLMAPSELFGTQENAVTPSSVCH